MITCDELKEKVVYFPESGVFIRKSNSKIIGVVGERGYIRIWLRGRQYLAHRLAWLYVHGEWPDCIDHINHNNKDNRISNLRGVTRQENLKNKLKYKNNKSGVSGVHWASAANKWRARIVVNKKALHLGYFDDVDEASDIIDKARIKHKFHENHGR